MVFTFIRAGERERNWTYTACMCSHTLGQNNCFSSSLSSFPPTTACFIAGLFVHRIILCMSRLASQSGQPDAETYNKPFHHGMYTFVLSTGLGERQKENSSSGSSHKALSTTHMSSWLSCACVVVLALRHACRTR